MSAPDTPSDDSDTYFPDVVLPLRGERQTFKSGGGPMTSQDTLVAHLRTTHICPSRECEAAANALEAQAARITELEAAIRAALNRATMRSSPDYELEDVLGGDTDGG